jgi:DNA-binding response OmpR family regulator
MGKTKTILVIEDNLLIATMVQFILKSEGFTVLMASDADEAMELLLEHDPDLVVSDVTLPRIDGILFMKVVRAIKDIPVILMTALSKEENKELGLSNGAVDFISKPFDPQDFVFRVRRILDRV